jgi:mono/diheme cytochrome c family protein
VKTRTLLLSLAVIPVLATRLAAQAPTPKDLYDANCKKCHGVLGTPPKAMKEKFPKIATFDAAFIAKHTADSIITILTKGKGEDMKPFKGTLSAADMAAVAKYVHELATRPKAGGE